MCVDHFFFYTPLLFLDTCLDTSSSFPDNSFHFLTHILEFLTHSDPIYTLPPIVVSHPHLYLPPSPAIPLPFSLTPHRTPPHPTQLPGPPHHSQLTALLGCTGHDADAPLAFFAACTQTFILPSIYRPNLYLREVVVLAGLVDISSLQNSRHHMQHMSA